MIDRLYSEAEVIELLDEAAQFVESRVRQASEDFAAEMTSLRAQQDRLHAAWRDLVTALMDEQALTEKQLQQMIEEAVHD